MAGLGRVQSTKKYDIKSPEPTDQRSVLIQRSPSPDFNRAIFKKWEKNAPPFSQSCSEKGGEAGESGVPAGKKSSPSTPASPPSPPFSRAF